MIKACIFDLDGTLLRTQASIAKAVNRTLNRFGLPSMPVENFNYYAGDGLDNSLKRALKDAGDPELKFFEQGSPLAHKLFAEDPLYEVEPYPHIIEALKGLKDRGIACAVLSNKPDLQVKEVIDHFFGKNVCGREIFDHLQGASENIPIKPDPKGALQTIAILGVKREEVLYFGDTNTDMETAHNAGFFAVGVSWGFRPRAELEAYKADCIIDDPLEILELADEKNHE
ncbi:MAG: HAD family hydrolase [Eubacterium sp.]|nr:HAD family hydrolase [Eubacterium sp.]